MRSASARRIFHLPYWQSDMLNQASLLAHKQTLTNRIFTTMMSKLSALINDAKAGLSIQEGIPQARWDAIAQHCGVLEIEEIAARINALKAELAATEAWDGDTRDDIHLAISRFSRLLMLTGTPREEKY